ncbi:aspartate kinase [Pedobacter sp. HMF7647]|uniref:Aspartokinase n=1 Tax=Hufsiella arboris TaxID=2695275 RepID=A0A7K1Y6R8_9SPHI|nr:aspartate kinase [Hufsiella arboris]
MQVYKFGGASVQNSAGIKNVCQIISQRNPMNLLVVVSAIGNTTNLLEKLTSNYMKGLETGSILNEIRQTHYSILHELFDNNDPVFDDVENTFVEIDWMLEDEPHENYDFVYDQIVSVGELLSTKIISAWLTKCGVKNKWIDARSLIYTDNSYREAQVDWNKTSLEIKKQLPGLIGQAIGITQGFIGSTSENFTTTLGREGSDYSAAIISSCIGAESLTVWKDVPGIFNADPKLFPQAVKFDSLSYREALEMTYYGANIIHPKTIKPLQNAGIPLHVKPYDYPDQPGTVISPGTSSVNVPAIIIKKRQVLISISTRDHSFITETHLSDIFDSFAGCKIKINAMQNSAISFSACFDLVEHAFEKLKERLSINYLFRYNEDVQLITIRHFKQDLIDELSAGKTIMLEQLSRITAQLVVK